MGLKERLLQFIEYKGLSVQKFENIVGLSNGAVSKMSENTRRSTLDRISNTFKDLNMNWILTNEGSMIINDVKEIEYKNEVESKDVEPYSTYLLPMSAMGGSLTGFAASGTMLINCESVVTPIANVDFAITVYGESMAPEYPSGSRVLIKRINPDIFIDWGKSYVLDTPNGVIIKEIHESEREGYVKCCSVNPDPKFKPFNIPINEIYGWYRVLMCMAAK